MHGAMHGAYRGLVPVYTRQDDFYRGLVETVPLVKITNAIFLVP
jgi:hypothetical protein